MDRKPCPNRTKRPKYSRSDFKIFSDEKRWELINIKLMAYDEYCQKQMTEKPTHELLHISLPQLSAEIHQMWSRLSTEDRNKYRPRAILDIKRRRVAKKDDRWDRTNVNASMDTVPSQSPENKNLPPLPAMSMEYIDSTPQFHSDPSDNDASSSLSWSKLDPTLLSDPMGLWLEQDDVAVPDRLMPGTQDLIFVDGTTMISEIIDDIDDTTLHIGAEADPIPVDPVTCKTQKQPSQSSSSSSLHPPYNARSRTEDGDSGVTSSSLHWNPPVEEQMTMLDINPSITMLHTQNRYAISNYQRPILSTYLEETLPPTSAPVITLGSNLPGYGHASPWNIGYHNVPVVYNYPVYPQFYHQVQSFHDASNSGHVQPNPFSPHCTFIRYPPYYPQRHDPAPVTTQHPIRNHSREINDSSKLSSVPTSN
jgi:hypothetical protein